MDEKNEESQAARIAMWGLVFFVMLVWRGPAWLAALTVPETALNDFCQDWVSARYWMEGRPVYAYQAPAFARHLGRTLPPEDHGPALSYNAHPPASLLLVLPLASLSYETASRVWTLFWLATLPVSFLIVARSLGLGLPWWGVFPVGTLLLWCSPLAEEVAYGQFNLPLLLMIVGGWAWARAGHPVSGGALLGFAAATKLFPAFLFLPYLLRRDWKVLAGGVIGSALATTATLALFGWQAHVEYATVVVPHVGTFRASWVNLSLTGFFARLFDPARGATVPVFQSRILSLALTGTFTLFVLAACVFAERGARTPESRDRSFALAVCGMLLLSPTTWGHYCLLLLMPVLLLWRDLSGSRWRRVACWLALTVLWLPPILFQSLVTGARPDDWWKHTAQPWQSLTGISAHFYALVLLFIVLFSIALAPDQDPVQPS